MSKRPLNLDDDQLFALMKFKRVVHDVKKPHHDDYFLVRWLRARNWNVEDAEKMLRDSLKWREKWEVDTKLANGWKAPEQLIKYYPSGLAGHDKDGAPLIVIPFLELDIYGLLHTASKEDMIRHTIQLLEYYLDLAAKSGENKVMGIIDLEGFRLRDFTYKPAAEFAISLIQIYEQNYPEILKKCFIINAPKVFAIAFSIVKNFLNDYTLSKIQIYKADPKKWKPALLEHISADQLPEIYGGTMVDPDGNPRCVSKIKLGGKIPKELYANKEDLLDNNNDYVHATVKKGEKLKLDYICADQGYILSWDFKTDGHDIKFAINRIDEDGNKDNVVPSKRVNCNYDSEVGVIECVAPSTYTVIFDNTYSYLRSKKIQYNIKLVAPAIDLKIETLPENGNNN
ncbi:SEC14-like protein 2 [Chrysoperla carnea]|uniref:SEC14-like protein 2 n=1 Tax=Chrysoperla carnea TaxID=189513 RepID=UPI001D089B51|nr:SEC14-like protein 2 [Chrysoperla carnea]